jgi:trehalose-6-phosphatase
LLGAVKLLFEEIRSCFVRLKVTDLVIRALLALSAPGSGNLVVVQSARSTAAMEACLAPILEHPDHNIALAAEYGMFVKVGSHSFIPQTFWCF